MMTNRLALMPPARILVITGIALSVLTTSVRADDEVATILARPLSPGVLALLIPHAKDSRVRDHWCGALAHSDPQTRAAAARLLHVAGAASAIPELQQALAKESDEGAALEAARALITLAGVDADPSVFDAARRLPPDRFALALAEARGQVGLDKLIEFRALKLSAVTEQEVVSSLVARDSNALDRVARAALEAPDSDLWLAVLNVAYAESLPVDPARVQAALVSPSAIVRDLAWWYVAILAADKAPLPDLAEALRAPHSEPGEATQEVMFGRELVSRALQSRTVEQTALLARASNLESGPALPGFGADALRGPLLRLLTESERKALNLKKPAPRIRDLDPKPSAQYRAIRTLGLLPDGYVADVLRQTGCKPGQGGEIAGAVIRYDAHRRLQQLQWLAMNGSDTCQAAARHLTAASLLPAPKTIMPGEPELVLLPMHQQFLQCLADGRDLPVPSTGPAPTRVGRAGVRPPHKIRDVRPVYPPAALAAGRQGIVFLDVTISPNGCVSRAEVLRSVSTDFDVAAIRAVTGWLFTPTLLNGQKVPVIMTVTMQFSLR